MRGCAKTPPGRRLSQLALARGALTGRVTILAAAARRDASPHHGSAGRLAPPCGHDRARPELQHLVDDGNGYVRANVTHMIPILVLYIKMFVL